MFSSSDLLLADECIPNFAIGNEPAKLKVGQLWAHGKLVGILEWQVIRFAENE
jgi:hypothetical protein